MVGKNTTLDLGANENATSCFTYLEQHQFLDEQGHQTMSATLHV
jgi:hypothetical protein